MKKVGVAKLYWLSRIISLLSAFGALCAHAPEIAAMAFYVAILPWEWIVAWVIKHKKVHLLPDLMTGLVFIPCALILAFFGWWQFAILYFVFPFLLHFWQRELIEKLRQLYAKEQPSKKE